MRRAAQSGADVSPCTVDAHDLYCPILIAEVHGYGLAGIRSVDFGNKVAAAPALERRRQIEGTCYRLVPALPAVIIEAVPGDLVVSGRCYAVLCRQILELQPAAAD